MSPSLKGGKKPPRARQTPPITRGPLACPAPASPVEVRVPAAATPSSNRRGAWIDGRERTDDGPSFPAISPVTGRVLAQVAEACDGEVDSAVFTARRALESGAWPTMSPQRRAQCLFRFAALLELRAGELAKLEAQDTGRPVAQTLQHEVPRAAAAVRALAQWIPDAEGPGAGLPGPGAGVWSQQRSRPRGVVAVVVSWQSVLLDLATAWASAWMAGCTVVTKPAPEASLLPLRLAVVAAEAGVPDGVTNVLPGPAECGAALVEHGGVDAVLFTGRPHTAVQVRAAAVLSGKPVIADTGGLCPALVLDDADAERAADQIAAVSFAFAGQLRRRVSRVLVSAALAEPLLLRLGEIADALTCGDPTDTHTRLGPMIDPARAEHARWITQRALGHGGRRVGTDPPPADHEVPRPRSHDAAVSPVVIDTADRGCPAVCRPVVGPLLAVTVHDSAAELVAAAQELVGGLGRCPAVGVWTRDLAAGLRVADLLPADHVSINALDPFGTSLDPAPLWRTQRITAALR